MKKFFPIALLLCLALLAGCKIRVNETFDGDALSKAQRIAVSDAATGAAVRELTTPEEIDAFVDAVTVGRWQFSELPEDAVREGAFTLYQTGTVHPDGREPGTIEICTLFSYAGEPYLTIATGVGDVSFSIPESAAAYLHGLLEESKPPVE